MTTMPFDLYFAWYFFIRTFKKLKKYTFLKIKEMLEVKVSIIRVHNNCSIKEIYQDISLLEYTTVVSNRYIRISVY